MGLPDMGLPDDIQSEELGLPDDIQSEELFFHLRAKGNEIGHQLNKVWHVWPGSNDFHWIGSLGLDSHWPVELTSRIDFLPDDIEAGPD